MSIDPNLGQGKRTRLVSSAASFLVIFLIPLFLFSFNIGDCFKGDEVNSIIHAKSGDLLPDVYKFPFYHYALGWLSTISENEVFLRFFTSTIFSLAALFFFFVFCKKHLDYRLVFLCAVLLAASPEFVLKGSELRMYPIMFLCIIASNYFLLEKNYTFYFVFFALGILSHPLFLVNIIINLIWLLSKKQFVLAFLIVSFAAMVILPWFETFTKVMRHSMRLMETLDKYPFGLGSKIGYGIYALCIGETVLPWNFVVTIPALIGFGSSLIAGCIFLYKKNKEFFFSLVVWLILPILLVSFSPRLNPKFIFFLSCVPFVILIGCGIIQLKYKLAIFVFFPMAYSLVNVYTKNEYHNMAYADEPKQVAQYISSVNDGASSIITSGDSKAIRYYLDKNIKPVDLKRLKEPPRKVIFVRCPMSPPFEQFLGKYNVTAIKNFTYDPHYKDKEKYLSKKFWEYRVQIYNLELK